MIRQYARTFNRVLIFNILNNEFKNFEVFKDGSIVQRSESDIVFWVFILLYVLKNKLTNIQMTIFGSRVKWSFTIVIGWVNILKFECNFFEQFKAKFCSNMKWRPLILRLQFKHFQRCLEIFPIFLSQISEYVQGCSKFFQNRRFSAILLGLLAWSIGI